MTKLALAVAAEREHVAKLRDEQRVRVTARGRDDALARRKSGRVDAAAASLILKDRARREDDALGTREIEAELPVLVLAPHADHVADGRRRRVLFRDNKTSRNVATPQQVFARMRRFRSSDPILGLNLPDTNRRTPSL